MDDVELTAMSMDPSCDEKQTKEGEGQRRKRKRGEEVESEEKGNERTVPFLNPTAILKAEASSRWTWDSVVRAPIAPLEKEHEKTKGFEVSDAFSPHPTRSRGREVKLTKRRAQQ